MADPSIAISQAVQAYRSAVKTGVAPTTPLANDENIPKAGDGFGDLVKGALLQAKEINKRGEEQSLKGMTDRTDLNKVVTAVAEAEVTLQTVVSIRDKVIDAYKEILRMPM